MANKSMEEDNSLETKLSEETNEGRVGPKSPQAKRMKRTEAVI